MVQSACKIRTTPATRSVSFRGTWQKLTLLKCEIDPIHDLKLVHSLPKLEGSDLWEIFTRNFSAVNGKAMTSTDQIFTFLKQNQQLHGYCDPALYDAVGRQLAAAGLTVETEYHRDRYDDYQFGVTRATGAIAESGSVILDDERTSHRLAALSPWVSRDAMISTIRACKCS